MHLKPVLDFVYEYMRPGTFTLVLAVVAAVTALPKVADAMKDRWWLHGLALVAFFSIAAAEIMVIRHAAKEDEERVSKLQGNIESAVANTTEIQQTLNGYIQSQTLVTQVRIEQAQHHKGYDQLLELKSRAAAMSSKIFGLLVSRSFGQPLTGSADPSSFRRDQESRAAFDAETVLWYDQKYGADTQRLVADLEEHGLKDDELKRLVAMPTNTVVIRIIASHLAAQAERITSEGIKPPNQNVF
jgi:membrane protein implicated in regulation of membrane protease activity